MRIKPPTLDGIWITELEPREGIPLAVKDLFDTAGVLTTYGSAVFADHVPSQTAEAVRRLEAAGYAVAGKTNLHEFAYGVTSQNPHYGTVPNPAAPGRTSGGSSGGTAAAIAAGLVDVGLGTDTRRVDPHPRRVLRHRRLQADLRARADGRHLPAGAELRPRRPDGARRARLRRADGGARARLRVWTRATPRRCRSA